MHQEIKYFAWLILDKIHCIFVCLFLATNYYICNSKSVVFKSTNHGDWTHPHPHKPIWPVFGVRLGNSTSVASTCLWNRLVRGLSWCWPNWQQPIEIGPTSPWGFGCANICTHVCKHTHTHTHTHTCTCPRACLCVRVGVGVGVQAHVHTDTHVCSLHACFHVLTCVCMHVHTHMCVCVCVCIQKMGTKSVDIDDMTWPKVNHVTLGGCHKPHDAHDNEAGTINASVEHLVNICQQHSDLLTWTDLTSMEDD